MIQSPTSVLLDLIKVEKPRAVRSLLILSALVGRRGQETTIILPWVNEIIIIVDIKYPVSLCHFILLETKSFLYAILVALVPVM